MVVYIEKSKRIYKLLALVKEFSRFTGYKMICVCGLTHTHTHTHTHKQH